MNLKRLFFYIFLTLIIGSLPSIFVYSSDIYDLIDKPIEVPSIVFPIVWTILFVLMAISLYLIREKTNDSKYLKIYFLQLFVNTLWTPVFFGLGNFFLSCFVLIILIVLVSIMIYMFYKEEKVSAYLNIPYLIWLLFALYLNIGIYLLNR